MILRSEAHRHIMVKIGEEPISVVLPFFKFQGTFFNDNLMLDIKRFVCVWKDKCRLFFISPRNIFLFFFSSPDNINVINVEGVK